MMRKNILPVVLLVSCFACTIKGMEKSKSKDGSKVAAAIKLASSGQEKQIETNKSTTESKCPYNRGKCPQCSNCGKKISLLKE